MSIKATRRIPPRTKVEFRLKLLSGNNVLLVDASGYESEIFMPEIINGRIAFQNVIPNRRCCPATKRFEQRLLTALTHHSPPGPHRNSLGLDFNNQMRAKSECRMSAGQDISSHMLPMTYNKENKHTPGMSRNMSQSSTMLPTPEYPRCTATPMHMIKDTLVTVPNGVKVVRLYRSPAPNMPQGAGLALPPSPHYAPIPVPPCSTPRSDSCSALFPNTSPEMSERVVRRNTVRPPPMPPSTVTKWRKCITPTRTYGRRYIAASGANSLRRANNSTLSGRRKKVQPSYLANPTQGPRPTMKFEVRKRKLLIDTKRCISPRSFKQQLVRASPAVKVRRKRKDLEVSREAAIDLLTNPTRVMSAKLKRQFRTGCITKPIAASSKYKLLCTVPPLGGDSETLAIRTQLENNDSDTMARPRSRLNNLNAPGVVSQRPPEGRVTFRSPPSNMMSLTSAAIAAKRIANS